MAAHFYDYVVTLSYEYYSMQKYGTLSIHI